MCLHVRSGAVTQVSSSSGGGSGARSSAVKGAKGLLLEGESNREFVGTFRWGPAHVFERLPPLPSGLATAYRVVRGWKQYLAFRYPGSQQDSILSEAGVAVPKKTQSMGTAADDKLVIQPSLLDGVSFPVC
jgi:hypothetical protein